MDVYHECLSDRGAGLMRVMEQSNKRFAVRPSIVDAGRQPTITKYWQPYSCIDCGHVVYELVESGGE